MFKVAGGRVYMCPVNNIHQITWCESGHMCTYWGVILMNVT